MASLLATSLPALAADFEFAPADGFRHGCEAAGIEGGFRFQRNGRVATVKFPQTDSAWVVFQEDESDPGRWRVRNRQDELSIDFSAATLAYRYDDGRNAYDCQGRIFRPGESY